MKRKKENKRRLGWIIALAVSACVLGFAGYMALNAFTLHLRRATVRLQDLPPAFEGKTILFASDIDLCGVNSPRRAAEVFNQLEVLKPDMLILGGDYTAPGLMDLINQTDVAQFASKKTNARAEFFHYICDFPAAMGRYMIASPEDRLAGDVKALAQENGFTLLDGTGMPIPLGPDVLWLVGLGEDTDNINALSRHFRQDDCVIALTYSPTQFPAIMTSEASDSGHWVDLNLSGHTHGGQIKLFGRSILSLDPLEQQFLYGWNRETGVPMLVSSGMGCEGANLRLGTQAEVWLITLTSGSQTME